MAEFVLHHHPLSRSRTIRWMLEETGRPYELSLSRFEDPAPGALLAANPMRKVPVLVHGDTVVSESAAICAYLADAVPEAGLAPPPPERGAYYRWLFFAAGPLEQATTAAGLNWTAPPGSERMLGYGSLDRCVDTLEAFLSGRDWVTHDRFTAADLYLGAFVAYAMLVGALPERPAFAAYRARIDARPARIRATAADDALAERLKAEGRL